MTEPREGAAPAPAAAALRVPETAPLELGAVRTNGPASQWRYASALPLPAGLEPVSLGEGFVPVETLTLRGMPGPVSVLREDQEPSGSWRDRAASLLVSTWRAAGAQRLVGWGGDNAALSLARYAAAATLECTIVTHAGVDGIWDALLTEQRCEVLRVDGDAHDAEALATRLARAGAVPASAPSLPAHPLGGVTAAFNLVEGLGRAPAALLVPAGDGALLAGLAQGFRSLGVAPRLFGVEPAACAPLAAAHARGDSRAAPATATKPSPLTRNFVDASPAWDAAALAAAHTSGGAILTVDDLALDRALRLLWHRGLIVEPAAAAPLAALLDERRYAALAREGDVALVMTGHGLRAGRSICPGL